VLEQTRDAEADKTGLSGLEDVLQKVSLARALLQGGEASKAKGPAIEPRGASIRALSGAK
jgi:hypothetical protein